MLHVCVLKFNVTDTVGKFLRTNQGLSNTCLQLRVRQPLYTMEWAVTGLSRLLRNCLSAQIEIGPLLRFVICKQAAVVHIRNRIRNSEFLMMMLLVQAIRGSSTGTPNPPTSCSMTSSRLRFVTLPRSRIAVFLFSEL